MKVVTAFAAFSLLIGTLVCADVDKEPKQIEIAQLDPSFDGTDVVMSFKVTKCYRISGGVPKGRVPTFGIEAVTVESDPRFSVLVGGELADAMGRFGFGPTRGENSLTGFVIEARGKIRMYPAPKDAAEKGPSYSFIIEDWKGFRFKPTSERP